MGFNNHDFKKHFHSSSKRKKQDIINKLIDERYCDLTVAIKSPNPKGEHEWGDYFFALALKKSFKRYGFNVLIQEREEWYDSAVKADINVVLRGLYEYEPSFDEINVMWNISHPTEISNEEYELYDICFISSELYANKLNGELNTIVKPLLQCTDPDVFYTDIDDDYAEDILFVGRSRGVFRQIVKDALQTDHEVSVYGGAWGRFLTEDQVKGLFIPNEQLHKYYSSCKILLNDHWEEMKNLDFPSNRIFDSLACGAFVISDKIPSADTLFDGAVVTYEGVDDLNNKITYYLDHEDERRKLAEKGKEIVLKNHTFDNRADVILDNLKSLKIEKF